MASLFSKIISGEIPSYKVAENEEFFAFLDIFPLTEGHTLVVPKKEVDYIFNLDAQTYLGLMEFSKKVAKAIEDAVPCKRIALSVIGLEIPHAHVHLIPINHASDCDFSNPKLQVAKEKFETLAIKISSAFNAAG